MSKSISQQVREKVKEASAKAEQGDVPAENAEAVGFIASATPTTDAPAAVDADAPEASDATPLESAPAAAGSPEAAPAAETTTAPKPSAAPASVATGTPSTASASDDEEWEDAEWDDDSVGAKYRIKAPKGMAEKIKGGWMAQADYSRKTARLAHFQAEFQPLIESGYMDRVLPLYRTLNQDEVLAAAVAQLYQQRMANQPLAYVQPGFEQSRAQPQAQPQQQEEQPYADDPYLQSIMQPIRSEIGQMRSYLEETARAAEQQRTQAQQAEARRAAERTEWAQIHQGLRTAFPGEFSGDQRDIPKLQQLRDYADRAGYSRESHGWYGRILSAKQEIDRLAPRPVAHAAAVPSAGAAAVQAHAEEIARQARTEVANGTVVSGSSQPAEPLPPRPPRTRDKAGNPLPVKQAMKNIINSARARTEAKG